MNAYEYINKKYNSLPFVSLHRVETNIFGIQFPLKPGWYKEKYLTHEITNKDAIEIIKYLNSLKLKHQSISSKQGIQVLLDEFNILDF